MAVSTNPHSLLVEGEIVLGLSDSHSGRPLAILLA
jgi:hypothetical protein